MRHDACPAPGRDTARPGPPPTRDGLPSAAPLGPVGECGAAAVSHTVAIVASMLIFVLCANVIVALYGRGVVRGALDEGVRAGARTTAGAAQCQAHVDDVLAQLLGGSFGDGVAARCAETTEAVTATADVVFAGWLPGVPDLRFRIAATATRHPHAGAAP